MLPPSISHFTAPFVRLISRWSGPLSHRPPDPWQYCRPYRVCVCVCVCVLISVIVFFSCLVLFYIYYYLLKFSLYPSILLLTWGSIFIIVTLNTFFSGRMLIPVLSSSFYDAVSCYFICNIFLCCLMFSDSLCLSIH